MNWYLVVWYGTTVDDEGGGRWATVGLQGKV